MKIREVRTVDLDLPRATPASKPRRAAWIKSVPRGQPLNKYAEFPPQAGFDLPAMDGAPVWVQVVAENGDWGLGFSGFGQLTAGVIETVFAPLLQGRDCMATEFLNDLMWRSCLRLGAEGHATIARSGVDLALWDLKGKLLDQPVYRLLGGPCRDKIKLYATTDDLDWAQELGFTAFKISNPAFHDMGIEGLDLLEEHVARARETVGPHAELMLNPIMAYNVEYAVQVAERLRPYRLRWLEEPLIPSDLRGHIELKKSVPWMPIATGEDHHGRHAFLELVENRCVDVVQPDINWCGGLTEAIKIYAIAEAAGLQTSPHTGGSTPFGQHFALAFPEVGMAEYWIDTDPGIPLEEAVPIPGMAIARDGFVEPSQSPGFGLEIREEWIAPRSG